MDDSQPTYADQTPPWNYSDAPNVRKRPSAKLQRLIAELGLRYRPSSQSDLEAHAGTLALLVRDLSDIPEDLLARAIEEWVRGSHFLPRASDLIERCQSYLHHAKPSGRLADLAEMNANLLHSNPELHAGGVRWYREGEALKLGHERHWNEADRCTSADARRILREEGVSTPFLLEILGSIERAEARGR